MSSFAAARGQTFTEEEYLAAERRSETKNEWRNGRIVAMSGGSPKHALLAGNMLASLKVALRGRPCLVQPSDQRVHVVAASLYTYPDVTVTCDKPQFHVRDPNSLTNPKVIVEVLSASTEAYDRGRKFEKYQSIPSLIEYVLVSQNARRVDHFHKVKPGQWMLTVFEGDGPVVFPTLECEIPMSSIYEGMELLEEAGDSPAPPSSVTTG